MKEAKRVGAKTVTSDVGLGAGASAAAVLLMMARKATKTTAKSLSFKDSIFQ